MINKYVMPYNYLNLRFKATIFYNLNIKFE